MELTSRKPCIQPFQQPVNQIQKPCIGNKAEETKTEEQKSDLVIRATIQIVAVAFELDPDALLKPQRGSAKIARSRQVSCYLLHTSLSLPLVEIGKIFGKDRTTIGHACRLVEDLRDEPSFDDRIVELEKTIRLVKDLASFGL
ncbi:MAG: helix-turn-helix domain-containing protein [Pseudomonadota bacterium]